MKWKTTCSTMKKRSTMKKSSTMKQRFGTTDEKPSISQTVGELLPAESDLESEDQNCSEDLSDNELDGNDAQHEKLLHKIGSLGHKRKFLQRNEASSTISEFNLGSNVSNGAGHSILVQDLLEGLEEKQAFGHLAKKLSKLESVGEPLNLPLSKPAMERIHRAAAYKETSTEVSKWVPIVQKNRQADHLIFPLQEEKPQQLPLSARMETFQPMTELEKEIADVLAGSSNVEKAGEELTDAEKKALLRMSVEEAKERRRELQKMRALMLFHEQKCKRTKKIKSKKYHRMQRKRKELESQKNSESSMPEDVEKADRIRVKERMTLKHGTMGKWAKKQLARGHRDPGTQLALSEHHQRRHALKQKAAVEFSESEDQNSGEEEKVDVFDKGSEFPQSAEVNTIVLSSSKSPASLKSNLQNYINTSSNFVTNSQETALGVVSNQLMNIHDAFAADDVVEDFMKEKQEASNSASKSVDVSLPGWGSWGGEGIAVSQKKPTRHLNSIPKKQTKLPTQAHVIINEECDQKAEKHQVNYLPWPYTNRSQFELAHRAPLGRQWNSESTVSQLIAPKICTAIGKVIPPITFTEDVAHFMKRQQQTKLSKIVVE